MSGVVNTILMRQGLPAASNDTSETYWLVYASVASSSHTGSLAVTEADPRCSSCAPFNLEICLQTYNGDDPQTLDEPDRAILSLMHNVS